MHINNYLIINYCTLKQRKNKSCIKTLDFAITFVGADIDTLLVAPRHVDRSDFFGTFYDILKNNEDVKELRVSLQNFITKVHIVF